MNSKIIAKPTITSFYELGLYTNYKSYYLYKNVFAPHDYHINFFLNYNFNMNSNNLDLVLHNKYKYKNNNKNMLQINNHLIKLNLKLLTYPNRCLHEISNYTKKTNHDIIYKNIYSEYMQDYDIFYKTIK